MEVNKYYFENLEELKKWGEKNIFGLFIFNISIMLLILLRSAGYFAPFFPLTINFIVFVALILSVFLLGLRSKGIFLVGLILWILSGLLRILNIDVWAERSAIYMYQSLIIGVFLIIIESIRRK